MSIVRYTNKKTGTVAIYESTSCYDPETKQSRPKRKYLGTEDPVTGQLIPSSGRRGRKKADADAAGQKRVKKDEKSMGDYEELKRECAAQKERIKQLEHENKKLRFCIQKLSDTAAELLAGINS